MPLPPTDLNPKTNPGVNNYEDPHGRSARHYVPLPAAGRRTAGADRQPGRPHAGRRRSRRRQDPDAGAARCQHAAAGHWPNRSELLLCTYNADAAGELRQRFDAVASAADYGVNTGRARVCTIHSLCGRLLAQYPERVGLRRGFRLLDKQQQSNLLQQRFDDVFGPDLVDLEGRGWRRPTAVVKGALKYFERICDEVINPRDLTRSRSSFIAAVGRCYRRYERLLLDENAADFAHLQAWADLLLDDDDVADAIAGGIRYLMCDEYQDTSHVQERILTRLSAAHGNLCVVGDEDQSLYRFRGAVVRNILGFAKRFHDCRVVELTVNYRSHPDIVSAYDGWMGSADWSNPDPEGAPFRHAKTIVPHDPCGYDDYPAVIAVEGQRPRRRGQATGGAAAVPEKPRSD